MQYTQTVEGQNFEDDVYIIVAVRQATNSGAAGSWRSLDRQLVTIEVPQFWIHPLKP